MNRQVCCRHLGNGQNDANRSHVLDILRYDANQSGDAGRRFVEQRCRRVECVTRQPHGNVIFCIRKRGFAPADVLLPPDCAPRTPVSDYIRVNGVLFPSIPSLRLS